MKAVIVLLTTTVVMLFASMAATGQNPASCDCQGGGDVTITIPLCVSGTTYSATVTRCEKWRINDPNLSDPCGTTRQPDAVTFFKKICLDSTINFVIDDVLKAVVCYFDPCLGNGLGASVPTCSSSQNDVFCWAYGFPKCWTRTSAGCYQSCGEDLCCWRHRRYCVNPITGQCQLIPGVLPNDWSCSSDGGCNMNCMVANQCTPEPTCSTCP